MDESSASYGRSVTSPSCAAGAVLTGAYGRLFRGATGAPGQGWDTGCRGASHRGASLSGTGRFVIGAAIGLALGIAVALATDIPFAPEVGAVVGGLLGWLSSRGPASG